ncbi:acylphosphatase-2-like isoform X2 [Hyposmocoma kahamanoa]|uniref:acylphosphatase-2-like isoform X2 n=1 Tax=Hyposmocoma kahamanoa TaxID=1477025 RepID=UPI000E6D5E00|nr:acylphosphatase-2-like isoform X2 [Hyposmocoma kahamanoa]
MCRVRNHQPPKNEYGLSSMIYTKEQADKLGVRGWCKNTRQGTVVGHMQGPPQKVHQMVIWLRSTGSPNSIIDRVIYRNGSEIAEYTFEGFEIRKS